jgi:hypothetical protein
MKHDNIVEMLSKFAEVKIFSAYIPNWHYATNACKTITWLKLESKIIKSIHVYPENIFLIKSNKSPKVYARSWDLEDKKVIINALDDFLTIETNKTTKNLNIHIEITSKELKRTNKITLQDLSDVNEIKNKEIEMHYIPMIQLNNIDFGMIDNFLNDKIDSGIFLDYLKEYYPEAERFIS